MAREPFKRINKRDSNHPSFIDPMDVPDRIYHLLHNLSISMGIDQPYDSVQNAINYLAQNPASLRPLKKRKNVQLLNEYCQRFEKLQQTDDEDERVLSNSRYEVFMHLYRKLQKVVPNEAKRYDYMRVCFEIFEIGNPEHLSKVDALKYRLNYIDRINEQVKKLKSMLKVNNDNVNRPICKRAFKVTHFRMGIILRPRKKLRTLELQQCQLVLYASLAHVKPLICYSAIGLRFMHEILKEENRQQINKINCNNESYQENVDNYLKSQISMDCLLMSNKRYTTCGESKNFQEHLHKNNDIVSNDLPTQLEQGCHVIIASRSVLDLFHALPDSEPFKGGTNVIHKLGPEFDYLNFFEQMSEYSKILEKSKAASFLTADNRSIPDITTIKIRIQPVLDQIGEQRNSGHLDSQVLDLRLKDFLTTSECESFESLCLQLANKLHEADVLQDVLHAMLGYEGKYLQRCKHTRRLHIRQPQLQEQQQQQHSISNSYFLVVLGNLGYYYRELKRQSKALRQLGQCGLALSDCVRNELEDFYQFHKQQLQQPDSLLKLLCRTRGYQVTYKWLLLVLQRCVAERQSHALPWVLYNQLGHGNEFYDELLCKWLVCVSQTVFQPICDWLLQAKLPADGKSFFITDNENTNMDNFWKHKYGLQLQYLPPFLNEVMANKMLNTGKCIKYCQVLQMPQNEVVSTKDLPPMLKTACEKWFRTHDDYALYLLFDCLEVECSGVLLCHLRQIHPIWDQLHVLHKYLLLGDNIFVSQLMEQLAMPLEQPAEFYDAKLLNYMLEEVLGSHSNIYVSKAETTSGDCCWSYFLLRCQLATVWRPLLQHSLDRYDQLFCQLWMLHRTSYVLRERIWRQQNHFKQRINLNLADMKMVQSKLTALINQLLQFIRIVLEYIQKECIARVLAQLESSLDSVNNVNELLEVHEKYLNELDLVTFRAKSVSNCRRFLLKICGVVFKLDEEQQKFIRLCHILADSVYAHSSFSAPPSFSIAERLFEFRWSCQNTIDVLASLENEFGQSFKDFLVALYFTRIDKFEKLANRLAIFKSDKEQKQLESVQSFEFLRKSTKI